MLERVMHNRFFRGTALFVRRYFDHRVARDSAALTYYLLFAMFPLLIFLSNLVGFFAVDIEGFLRQLGMLLYNCQKFRIRRTLRGEKPAISGYCSFRNSAAATAAPFSERVQTILPTSQYSFICGRSASMADSSAANIAL